MGFDIDEDRRQLIHEFKQKLEEAFDRYYENLLAGLDRAFEGLKEKNPMEDVTVKEEKELDEEPEMTKMSEEKEDEAAATNGHSEMEDFTASKVTTYRSMSNPLEMSEETIMEEEVKISGHEVFDEMHNTKMEEIGVDFGPGNVQIQQLSLEGSTEVEYLGVDYQQYQDVTTDEDEIKTFWLFYPGIKLCVDVESDSEAEKTGQEDDAKLIAAAIGDVEAHKAQNQVIDGGDVARPPVQLAHGGDVAEGSKDGHLNVVVGQNLFLENSLPTKFIYIKEIIMGQEEDFKLDKSYQAGNYSMQGNNQALCNRLHQNEVKVIRMFDPGIPYVVVYSTNDTDAFHVKLANEFVKLSHRLVFWQLKFSDAMLEFLVSCTNEEPIFLVAPDAYKYALSCYPITF